MTKGLNFLKEGLSPQEKTRITKAFNKAVNEKVKIEIVALVEAQLNGMFKSVKKSLDEDLKNAFKAVNKGTKNEIKRLSEGFGQFVDYMIQSSLPKPLIETVAKGLTYAEHISKIEEGIRNGLQEEALGFVKEEFEQLREEKRIAEEKHQHLFERMVTDANTAIISKRRGKAKKLIESLPDKEAKIVDKIINSNIDFSAIDDKDIPKKIKEIHESVIRAMKKDNKDNGRQQLDEGGRGNIIRPTVDDYETLNEDVAFALDVMENTTFNRGQV